MTTRSRNSKSVTEPVAAVEAARDPSRPTFTGEDEGKLVELLNFLGTHARFKELDIQQVIKLYRLLNWAQKQLLPKVSANVFEVLGVRAAAAEEKSE